MKRKTRDDVWNSVLWTLPSGILAATMIVLRPGHLWSVEAFSPKVMGSGGVVRFAVSFMVICLGVMWLAEAVRRSLTERRESGKSAAG